MSKRAEASAQLERRLQTVRNLLPMAGQRLWARFVGARTQVLNRLVSRVYGQPMQVLPRGHVGLAGAVVLWYLQDGFKQFVMVRNVDGKGLDGRARFVSCLGLGSHATVAGALRAVLEAQCGMVFTRTLPQHGADGTPGELFASDRVAGAPVFNYTDEASGVSSPVQALVWVMQIQPAQLDLIESGGGVQTVMVPEFALSSQKVSPTHRALWQAVQRHIPKGKLTQDAALLDESAAEDAIKDISDTGTGGQRVLH